MKFIGLFFLLLVDLAEGHPLDLGYIQLNIVGSHADATLDLNPKVAETLSSSSRRALGGSDEIKIANDFLNATLASAPFTGDGKACVWSKPFRVISSQTVRIAAEADCETTPKEFHWAFPFISQKFIPATFQVLVKVNRDGIEHLYNAERGREELSFVLAAPPSFQKFVLMGMEHIGATADEWWSSARGFHLPDGIDHILFILGLCLAGGSLWSLFKTATGFTLGHSLTLGLATFNVVHLPSRWVEAAIALSIAYVAAEDLFVKKIRHRFWLAMFFGLVHGFGFASALSELHLSRQVLAQALVGFNVGVELGQLIILSVFVALLTLLSQAQWFLKLGRAVCASGVFLAGAIWFVQRAFG